MNKTKEKLQRKSQRAKVQSERERTPEQPNVVRRDHNGSKLPVTRSLNLSSSLPFEL